MEEIDFAFRTLKYVGGAFLAVGTIAWRYYDKVLADLKDKLIAWGETKIIENRGLTESKMAETAKLYSEHSNDLVSECHRRIDRVSSENNTANKALEIDMALLKHKSDSNEQAMLKMESRMEKMSAKIDGMVDTVDRTYREMLRIAAVFDNKGDSK